MDTFPNKILNPIVFQLDFHDGVFATPPPIAGRAFHFGVGILLIPSPISLGISTAFGDPNWKGKLNILADNIPVVAKGHTAGLIVPHLNLFPFLPFTPNTLISRLILLSENVCKIGVSSVFVGDESVAVSIFKGVGLNWGCNDLTKKEDANRPVALEKNLKSIVKNPKELKSFFGFFKNLNKFKGKFPNARSKLFINKFARPLSILFNFIPTAMVYNWGTVNIGLTFSDIADTFFEIVEDFVLQEVFNDATKNLPEGTTNTLYRDFNGQMKNAGSLGSDIMTKILSEGTTKLYEATKDVTTKQILDLSVNKNSEMLA